MSHLSKETAQFSTPHIQTNSANVFKSDYAPMALKSSWMTMWIIWKSVPSQTEGVYKRGTIKKLKLTLLYVSPIRKFYSNFWRDFYYRCQREVHVQTQASSPPLLVPPLSRAVATSKFCLRSNYRNIPTSSQWATLSIGRNKSSSWRWRVATHPSWWTTWQLTYLDARWSITRDPPKSFRWQSARLVSSCHVTWTRLEG